MTYASESFGGASTPTYLTSAISASDLTATFHDLTDWVEVDSTGAATTQPLGTSGPFCIKLEWGTAREETVQCSGLDPLTGVVTFIQRGFDGTTAQTHPVGSKGNCFPTDTATDWINVHDAISTAVADSADALALAQTADSNASSALSAASAAQSTADGKVASVTAADSTITIAGTATAPTVKVAPNTFDAYGAAASKVASVTAADGTITVAGTATAPTVKVGTVPYGQVSGGPTSLPPSGSAGGDLSGTYPNPSVVAGSTTVAGKLQLTDSTSSTSTTTAATPNAVKSAYDLASTANTAAGAAQTTANAKVASVTAGDSTVTVGGTATAPTVKVTANTFDPYGAAAAKVASVTAGDTSITIGGNATAPTVAVNQANLVIAESQVTNLTTDLAAKAPTSRTISTTAPLAGGGDLSANRTLSIADASTSVKGAVQLTDSTASTSTTTAATPNSVKTAYDLANAALPKSGGTMTGRIQSLSLPGAATDPARAGDFGVNTSPSLHSLNAFTYDPAAAAGGTLQLASQTVYFSAIYVPYTMTISRLWLYVNTAGTVGTGASLLVGIYNSTTLLASTTNQASTMNLSGALGYTMSSSVSLTPGVYWIGILYVAGTGSVAPTYQKSAQSINTLVNFNNGNSNTSLLNQRSAGSSGRSTLPSDLTALSNITFNNHLLLGAIN